MKKEEMIIVGAEEKENRTEATQAHDKTDYMRRILALSPEDQAFMDGYLFAKVTSAAKGA